MCHTQTNCLRGNVMCLASVCCKLHGTGLPEVFLIHSLSTSGYACLLCMSMTRSVPEFPNWKDSNKKISILIAWPSHIELHRTSLLYANCQLDRTLQRVDSIFKPNEIIVSLLIQRPAGCPDTAKCQTACRGVSLLVSLLLKLF